MGDVEVIATEAAGFVRVEEHFGAVGGEHRGSVAVRRIDVGIEVDWCAPGVLALVARGDPEVERGYAVGIGYAARAHGGEV